MHKGAAVPPAPASARDRGLSPHDIIHVLDLADGYVSSTAGEKKRQPVARPHDHQLLLRELDAYPHSFRVAGKRLGGDVINMAGRRVRWSRGDPDRHRDDLERDAPRCAGRPHPESGAVHLLSEKVDCAVVNAGDGTTSTPPRPCSTR